MKVEIRPQKLTDANRLYEILTDKKYVSWANRMHLPARVKTLKEEKDFLIKSARDFKSGLTFGCTILADGKIVGAIAIMVNQHRKYIGEVGYLLDSKMWGKGITTKALKLISKQAFADWGIRRIELVVNMENKPSIRVAEKAGYKLEGIKRGAILTKEGKVKNALIYSLIRK